MPRRAGSVRRRCGPVRRVDTGPELSTTNYYVLRRRRRTMRRIIAGDRDRGTQPSRPARRAGYCPFPRPSRAWSDLAPVMGPAGEGLVMASWGIRALLGARARRSVAVIWAALFVLSILLQSVRLATAPPVRAEEAYTLEIATAVSASSVALGGSVHDS